MHSGMAPGTAISAAHSRGTAPNPISRMAVAGKMLVTSAVAVKSDADDVVLDQAVALHELAHQLLGALRDLVRGVRRRPSSPRADPGP